MSQKKLLYIVCDNGLGHTRRSLIVLEKLLSLPGGDDLEITLAVRSDRLARFNSIIIGQHASKLVKILNFETQSKANPEDLAKSANWPERLCKTLEQEGCTSLEEFNLVVSDNLVEILRLRPDTIIVGSFLWHQIWGSLDAASLQVQNWARNCAVLLSQSQAVLLGSREFTLPEAQATTQFRPVGLVVKNAPKFSNPRVDQSREAIRNSFLIATGLGGNAEKVAFDWVFQMLTTQAESFIKAPFDSVFVEPSIYSNLQNRFSIQLPEWLRAADFSQSMYASLRAAWIRPGMGTLTDALVEGVYVYAFYESNNREMEWNAQTLERLGVGETCQSLPEAWSKAKSISSRSIEGVDLWSGASDIAGYLKQRLSHGLLPLSQSSGRA